MEPPKTDVPKLPDMVMCGDHPSFTKTELNVKEFKPEEEKEKKPASYARISPSSSRTDRAPLSAACGSSVLEVRTRAASEHALRLMEARRRARSMDAVPRADIDSAPPNRALVQAALGSFRWPPYLLAVWVVVLVLTHVLHCLVTLLERALPNIKKFCQYFRGWTEDAWKTQPDTHRVLPLGLAFVTGLLYTLYFLMYTLYAVALWAIEPLCADIDDKHSSVDVMDAKVTNYCDEVTSKTNTSVKH